MSSARAATSRAHRGSVETPLFRLVRAAVRMADALEDDAGSAEFIGRDEEFREAALAYTRILSPTDRKRIGGDK